ncbi:hypothetical protein C8R44DRAFT_983657 [Mycena epipterygia]|nr:hypothetical protein C8R44DRAFT_983657 [Mycena epipterygia]
MLRLSTSASKFWLVSRLSVPGIPGLPQRARAFPTPLRHTMSSRSIFHSADPKTWYKTSIPLDDPWSCDWENWDNASYFLLPHLGLSPRVIRETWGVTGEIQPLAFLPGWYMPEPTYVFVADGVYYWATYGGLKRIDGSFESHDDFLRCLGEDEGMWARGTEMTNILESETKYQREMCSARAIIP